MRADLLDDVIKALVTRYGFTTNGAWLQKGKCPDCGKKELYASAENPAWIRCGRAARCGTSHAVKTLFPDLFDTWSTRFKATESDPTAAADAYLAHARRLNLTKLRGHYSQEQYFDREANIGSATVRFPLPGGSWWERLIDQPGRFGKMKARFAPGKSYKGEWWQPPGLTIEAIAAAPELWIAEGIFDAETLWENGIAAVSAMSCNNYPDTALTRIAAACVSGPRPRLIWAFDANAAGRGYIRKFVERATGEGWTCGAALTEERLSPKPRDWNDLHLLASAEHPAFSPARLDEYRWNGDVLLAASALDKGKLVAERRNWSSFPVEHGIRTWWVRIDEAMRMKILGDLDADDMTKALPAKIKRSMALDQAVSVDEIATCTFTPLYFQNDETKDEGSLYFRFDFPGDSPALKKTVSAGQVVNAADFAKRLAGVSQKAVFSGSTYHLLKMRQQPAWTDIRTVETVYVTGYVKEHGAYIFPEHAVAGGKIIALNEEDYFEIGKLAVKPVSTERTLDIAYGGGEHDASWLGPLCGTFGPRGMVALAYFLGTLFAEQIRGKLQSWPFLEIVGEPGGGKTTIIEFLWLLLGRRDYEGFDPSKSTLAFRARMMSKVGNLPVVFIESDRSGDGENGRNHARQFDWDELKTAYNGRMVRGRAVANGGMETLEAPFRGAVVISQNDEVNASPAILERIVSLRFSKAMQSPASRKAIDRLHGFDPAALSSFILAATRREPEILAAYFAAFKVHEKAMSASGVTKNIRLIKNHAQLLACLDALALVVAVPDEVRDATADFIRGMCGERHVAISADHPVVQAFWETYDYIEASSTDDQATWLNHSRDPTQISVSLIQFEIRCSLLRLQLPAPMADLKRHLKTSRFPKFIAAKTVNSRTGKTLHCWVFQRTARNTEGKD